MKSELINHIIKLMDQNITLAEEDRDRAREHDSAIGAATGATNYVNLTEAIKTIEYLQALKEEFIQETK